MDDVFKVLLSKKIPFQIKGMYASVLLEMATTGDSVDACLSRFPDVKSDKVLEKCIQFLQEYDLYPGEPGEAEEAMIQSVSSMRKSARGRIVDEIVRISMAGILGSDRAILNATFNKTWHAKQHTALRAIFENVPKEDITATVSVWTDLIGKYATDKYWAKIPLSGSTLVKFANQHMQKKSTQVSDTQSGMRTMRHIYVHKLDVDEINDLLEWGAFKNNDSTTGIIYEDAVPEKNMDYLVEHKVIHGAAIYVTA